VESIKSATELRLDYLRYQQRFYQNSLESAARYPTKAWVFSAPNDPVRLNLFVELLNFHRIKTYRLSRNIDVDGNEFTAGDSIIVPSSQSQHLLIRSIFETVTEFEDATFYDVSTWTMPPAFGLSFAPLLGRSYRDSLVGETISSVPTVAPEPRESRYGYVFEWQPYYAPRALQRVLEDGLLAKVATRPFTGTTLTGTKEFARGSIMVPLDRQEKSRDQIFELMQTIAAADHVSVYPLASGRSATGTEGIDAGGPSFRALQVPTVLLAIGDEQNLYDAGEVWHLLDFRMDMPVTLRDRSTLKDVDWSRYTHIVFPSGDYEDFEPDYLDRLRLWVNEGGTLIGMRKAVPWVRANTLDWIDPDDLEAIAAREAEIAAETKEEEPLERLSYDDKDRFDAVDVIGGAIFTADLDDAHPLGFGFKGRRLYLHKNIKEPLLPTDNPFGTVIAYSQDPVYSGYVSDKNRDALAGTPALIAERSNKGSIILFADNPNFRGYWYGTNKLFMNALFFSTVFDEPEDE
ncbi:MAG: hypothetical protein HKN77_10920, partial [Woeseiaceae bacterium]|nr:hypothetical protein [Woeseiaceae bacterium]